MGNSPLLAISARQDHRDRASFQSKNFARLSRFSKSVVFTHTLLPRPCEEGHPKTSEPHHSRCPTDPGPHTHKPVKELFRASIGRGLNRPDFLNGQLAGLIGGQKPPLVLTFSPSLFLLAFQGRSTNAREFYLEK